MSDRSSKTTFKVKHPLEIMRKSSLLKNLHSNAKKLLSIEAFIQQNLFKSLRVAAFEGKTLHLIAPSSTVATGVRYRQQTIINLLRNKYPIEKLKISVRPSEPSPPAHLKPPNRPSAENAKQIAITAKYIENEGLRKALIKLSERASDPKAAQ